MRLNLKQLQDLAKKKGLTVQRSNGTLFKYEIRPINNSHQVEYARSAGEAEYEIEQWKK